MIVDYCTHICILHQMKVKLMRKNKLLYHFRRLPPSHSTTGKRRTTLQERPPHVVKDKNDLNIIIPNSFLSARAPGFKFHSIMTSLQPGAYSIADFLEKFQSQYLRRRAFTMQKANIYEQCLVGEHCTALKVVVP